jgi:hypothetical protein
VERAFIGNGMDGTDSVRVHCDRPKKRVSNKEDMDRPTPPQRTKEQGMAAD